MATMAVSAALGVAIGISHISVSVDDRQITVRYGRCIAAQWHTMRSHHSNSWRMFALPALAVSATAAPGGRVGLLWTGGPGVEIETTDGKHITVVIDEANDLHEALARTT
ncbi:hypothetical protein ACFFX0_03205 [Citricoccus parietis]|uniref:Uncharacterized protein n=1 Tax=Citricoccus parietis TaxID=592307 RepID=A0ABV5FUX0_9MICC